MPRPKPKTGYKTKRKYSCPYCDEKMTRSDLVEHIQDKHEMMIPQGYNAARVVYDHINGKNYGTCFICGDKVYEWDDRLWRYKNLCNKPSCRAAVHQKAMNNHLNDPEKQKIMLQGRKISGEYKFKDGGKRSYTGSYERKCLEFMDKVMNIPSTDIETPGPVFKYKYKGEDHFFITDVFYIPAMLVIDVKDGGDNPNNRPMEDYRAKQAEKEKAVIRDGRYNYLRLTNNDFGQFMSAIADIRYGDIVHDTTKGIYIHEGAMPPAHHSQDWIVPCYMQGMNADDQCEFVFGNSALDKAFKFDKYGNMVGVDPQTLLERKIVFNKPAILGDINTIYKARNMVQEGKASSMQEALLDQLLERHYISLSDLYYNEYTELDTSDIHEIDRDIAQLRSILNEEVIGTRGKHLTLMRDKEGFYLTTTDNNYLITSDYYDNQEDIPSDIVELMDNLYEKNVKKEVPSDDV